jgi:hypothetical protein
VSATAVAAFASVGPENLDGLDLPPGVVYDLVLRRAHLDGTTSITTLSSALKLSPLIVQNVYRRLRDQRLIDVHGGIGDDYSFSLTRAGERAALARMKICQYAGPAPVSLRHYTAAVRDQVATAEITRADVEAALADLVVRDEVVSDLGPALISNMPLFLYGGTGNGKTCIAERLHRVYRDHVLVPYAVAVDGQIVVVYDPAVHRPVAANSASGGDARWVLCERPSFVVGGELTPAMLELRLDTSTRTYSAPVQMKANNGILVIDDFGRQTISPQKLLNRWVVPLDRRVDMLTVEYGVKFAVPFEVKVVIATNLEPHQLADHAFLRRLLNKIYIGPVSDEVFDDIFVRTLAGMGMTWEAGAASYMKSLIRRAGCLDLRACLPRDLASIARCVLKFEQRPPHITLAELNRAVDLYFTKMTGPGANQHE